MTEKSLHELSDEELAQLDFSTLETQEGEHETSEEIQEENVSEQTQTDEANLSDEENQFNDNHTEDNSELSDDETTDDNSSKEPSEVAIDYEQFHHIITTPFKANGRDIQVSSAEDAIRLMQMGANYSKKMEALKPKQALLKALEQHGLDNPDELGFLLDLKNKKPEAIAKLVSDGDIDLYSLDTSIASDYKPQLELPQSNAFEDTVVELRDSNPNVDDLVRSASQWDNFSKQALYDNPAMLVALSAQQANGFYDKVLNVIEYERMMGRMTGIPFLQAYSEIEAKLMSTQHPSQEFVGTRPNKTNATNNELKKRASVPNQTNTQAQTQIDWSKLSDEELAKLIP